MPGPARIQLIGAFAVMSLIWGTTWAAIRIGLEGIPPFTGVALRFALASAIILLLARWRKVPLGRSRRERALWLVNGVLAFTISYGVVYWCEQWVPSGLGAVLWATFPLFVGILAHFTLTAERLTLRPAVGIVLGFGGAAVIFSEDFAALGGAQVAFASAVFLISPLAAAVANVAVKRWGDGISPISLTGVPMGITAVVMGGLALLTERERTFTFDVASVGALLYLGLFGSAVTFILYYWMLSHVSATRASLVAYTIPLVAVVTGVVFLDEPMTARILIGSSLVLAGVGLAIHSGGRAPAKGL